MIACPACGFAAADVDDACGSCGAPLAVLSVVGGRVRLDAHSETVEVVVENRGKTGASFVLRSIDARSFPSWLVNHPDLDKAFVVPAGGSVPLRFFVDKHKLPLARTSTIGSTSSSSGSSSGSSSASSSSSPASAVERVPGRAVIPLLTSLVRYDEELGRGVRRVLAVELATQGRAVAEPRAATYRFIPRELVDDGRSLVRPIAARNDGGHPVQLVAASLVPRDVLLPRGAVLLAPEAIIQLPAFPKPEIVHPGDSHVVTAKLRLLAGRLPAGALGVFAADVALAFADGQKAVCSLEGVVGDGPFVRVVDNRSFHTAGRPLHAKIVVDNPGAVAVRVHSMEVLDLDDAHDEGDWLRLVDDAPFTLAPDESRAVSFLLDPEKRDPSALERPWGKRTLRFHHDGVARAVGVDGKPQRITDVEVAAELGRVRTLDAAVLGVDFGTSNSSTSLFFGPAAAVQPLALDREAGKEAMASLMFYVGEPNRDFLFGAAAENAAPLAWTNLVRNLKSVVAREPTTRWNFVDQRGANPVSTGGMSGASGTRIVETKTTQALLDRFVLEVKRRAEDGLRALPMPALASLGLVDTGVRFKHAIFSHPVGVDDGVLAALFHAAKSAGLAEGIHTEAQFAAERCIDEASAAVIAYVHIAAGAGKDALRAVDDEKLLCFDIGGGTTDIAAVDVHGLHAFRTDPAGRSVKVVLRASGGDARFGGSDIDRLLAGFLLDELAKRPELAPFEIDDVRRASFFPSYEAFRRARGAGEGSSRARAIYGRATDVLRAAERIKLALSQAASASVTSSFIPALDDWPPAAALAVNRPATGVAPVTTSTRAPRVEIKVTRGDLTKLIAGPVAKAAALVIPVIEDAGWRADDVTTLLFTGQSSRLDDVRTAVKLALMERRSPAGAGAGAGAGASANANAGARQLHVVEPGSFAAFDPKRCVAQGAAVWGDSKLGGGGWLSIERRSRTELAATLHTRRGPLLVDVPGLTAGTALPARAQLTFNEPQRSVLLYRAGSLAWTFDLPSAAAAVDVVVEAEHKAHAIVVDGGAGGVRVEGKRA